MGPPCHVFIIDMVILCLALVPYTASIVAKFTNVRSVLRKNKNRKWQRQRATEWRASDTNDENDDDDGKSSNVKHIYGIAFNFFL